MTDAETDLLLIPLGKIVPSPHNPRKTFDDDALGQLAESIRQKGVLEPILVRPAVITGVDGRRKRPGKKDAEGQLVDLGLLTEREPDGYEIVCGERRWRAAQRAELKVIPALVRNLDDKQAAEVGVIENDQREDVPPLEQARGYQRLIELGDDVGTIAAKIGRPPAYVAGRLQLGRLIGPLQEDLAADRLPLGHAFLLCRLAPEVQADIRKHGLYPQWGDKTAAVPVKDLRRVIHDRHLSCLSAAPWKKDDADLLPAAGACKDCPKRSGANPTLFDELLNGQAGKGRDYCLDRACYGKKRAAFVELQVLRAAEKNGGEVVRVSDHWHADEKGTMPDDAEKLGGGHDRLARPRGRGRGPRRPPRPLRTVRRVGARVRGRAGQPQRAGGGAVRRPGPGGGAGAGPAAARAGVRAGHDGEGQTWVTRPNT